MFQEAETASKKESFIHRINRRQLKRESLILFVLAWLVFFSMKVSVVIVTLKLGPGSMLQGAIEIIHWIMIGAIVVMFFVDLCLLSYLRRIGS